MGCGSSNYFEEKNIPDEDYFTKVFYESEKANKQAKLRKERERIEKEEKEEKERKEEEMNLSENEKKNKNNKKKGKKGKNNNSENTSSESSSKKPKEISYFDNLIKNEIPKMDFGNLASKKEIIEEMDKKEGIEKKTENEEEEEEEEEEDKIDNYYFPKNKYRVKDLDNQSNKTSEKNFIEFLADLNEIKVIVIGEEKSGKTSLIDKYTKDTFSKNYLKTNFIKENKETVYNNDGKDIQVIIIDTPPLPKGENSDLIQEEIYKSHCIIYIANLTHEIPTLPLTLTFKIYNFNEKQCILVLGNKKDIKKNIVKTNIQNLKNFCKDNHYMFDTISCKEDSKDDITHIIDKKLFEVYFNKYEGYVTESSINSQSNISKSQSSNSENKSENSKKSSFKSSINSKKENSEKTNSDKDSSTKSRHVDKKNTNKSDINKRKEEIRKSIRGNTQFDTIKEEEDDKENENEKENEKKEN